MDCSIARFGNEELWATYADPQLWANTPNARAARARSAAPYAHRHPLAAQQVTSRLKTPVLPPNAALPVAASETPQPSTSSAALLRQQQQQLNASLSAATGNSTVHTIDMLLFSVFLLQIFFLFYRRLNQWRQARRRRH